MPAVQVFVNSMSSANSLVTFDLGGPWRRVWLQIPSFASSAGLDIYVAVNSNATFIQMGQAIPQTTTAQSWSFTVAASASANGRTIPLTDYPFQYFRIKADSAPAAAVDFKVICSNNL